MRHKGLILDGVALTRFMFTEAYVLYQTRYLELVERLQRHPFAIYIQRFCKVANYGKMAERSS